MAGATKPRVDHVVVLMLENRSFDHMLGFLDHPDPVAFGRLAEGEHFNDTRSHGRVHVSVGRALLSGPDPDHSHAGALAQLAGFGSVPANGGFAASYERADGPGGPEAVMACLDPERQCPVLATLAKEFAVCTAWFSSVPGETWPNRNFAHAGTSDGTVDIELGFYYDPTIFELIARRGATWRIYHDGPPQVWCFRRLWRTRTLLDFLLRRPSRIGNWFPTRDLGGHLARGDLASYTFVEPAHNRIHDGRRRTNSQHPHNNLPPPRGDGPADFLAAEELVRSLYQGLRRHPELFERTLLVITYDEHGGFYDHVEPPAAAPPGDPVYRGLTRRLGRWLRRLADRRAGRPSTARFDFSRPGVRVPAVLVSPWIPAGTVVDTPLEHASIPATLRTLFAPDLPPLTKRDEAANGFADVVLRSPLDRPRPAPDLDEVVPPAGRRAAAEAEADAEAEAVAPGAVAGPPPGELDLELAALTDRMEGSLRRNPAVLARRVVAPVAERAGQPAPAEDATALFEETAERARRRASRPA